MIMDLGSVGAGDRRAVGGKGAGLGELIRAGIPVPAGFAVTVEGFEYALRALDPGGEIRSEIARLPGEDAAAIAGATARVRARIAAAPMPPDVRDQIEAAYRRLAAPEAELGRGVPVAVRSSATSEDGAQASFAGLQDTYLWVRGADQLMDRVRACWASVYNAEAVAYRRCMNVAEDDLAMAVVVQRMVEPRCSGVMFTRSPTTGDRSVIAIEGSWGLGSALVGGDVTPDSFVVSKVTGEIIRRSIAVKLRLHRAGPGGEGVAADDVPGPLRERPCLADGDIAALARLGRRVEDHYGAPQDIEWAITDGTAPGESMIAVLQSRPETVWARRVATPLATPRPRAVDHVFDQLGRVNVVRPER